MDRALQLRNLKTADLHVAEGARHIAEQKLRVVRLDQGGYDTTEAWKVLGNFYASQGQHIAYRDRLLKELGE